MNDPCCDPEDGIEKVIVVACCTFDGQRGNDDTCLLDKGDHDFFKHRSFVHYQRASLVPVKTLQEDYVSGLFKIKGDLHESIMVRVEEGMRYHERTSDEVNEFFQHVINQRT